MWVWAFIPAAHFRRRPRPTPLCEGSKVIASDGTVFLAFCIQLCSADYADDSAAINAVYRPPVQLSAIPLPPKQEAGKHSSGQTNASAQTTQHRKYSAANLLS